MLSTPIKVALIGGNGKLGPTILRHLLAHPTISPTVVSSQRSTSTYPPEVPVALIPDSFPHASLVTALRDHTAVIVTIAGSHSALQIRLADAAAEAGVRTFIPADFGSCDSSNPFVVSAVPVFAAKRKVREHLKTLSLRGGMAWTSLVCGHFFDYGLEHGLLHIDMKNSSALVFDGGDIKWSATTLDTVAKAVVKVLEMEKETRNRMLFIQSLRVSQNEVLDAVEEITGCKFKRTSVVSSEYIEERKRLHMAEPQNDKVFHDLCGVVGIVDADWESHKDFAVQLLGLENEDLDQLLRVVLRK